MAHSAKHAPQRWEHLWNRKMATVIEQLDRFFFRGLAWLLLSLGVLLPMWAAALVVVQCVTWLKTGSWQPVPVASVFMSPEAQRFNLAVVPARISPLDLAPSLASLDSATAVTQRVAGSAVGLARIVAWLLDVGLSVWLLAVALVCLPLAGAVEARASDFIRKP